MTGVLRGLGVENGGLRNRKEHDLGKRHRIPGEAIHDTDLWPVSSASSKLSAWFLSHTEELLEEARKRDREQWHGIEGTWKR